jgi:hypothetical protein
MTNNDYITNNQFIKIYDKKIKTIHQYYYDDASSLHCRHGGR